MRVRERATMLRLSLLPLLLLASAILLAGPAGCEFSNPAPRSGELSIVTWNLRGYPESDLNDRSWFHAQLQKLAPSVLCVQEIANHEDVEQFMQAEPLFTQVAFVDSGDGQDNAIFGTMSVSIEDLADSQGFQHPIQCARVSSNGFDAVVVTVHLSWANTTQREKEKQLLRGVVSQALAIDPDVVVVGDFNTEGADIEDLAQTIGLVVMNPTGQAGVGTTYAGHRYDHFLISQDLATEESIACQIHIYTGSDLDTARRVSDHRPVVARFRTDLMYRDGP